MKYRHLVFTMSLVSTVVARGASSVIAAESAAAVSTSVKNRLVIHA